MPTPLSLSDRQELVLHLRKERERLQRWFENLYGPGEAERLVRESVGANTFRAFGGMPERPSVVFRAWANERVEDPRFAEELLQMGGRAEYDRWLADFARDLGRVWESAMGRERALSYGHGRKMTNLLMKHVARWSLFDERTRRNLIDYLHVPLDSFSLLLLRCCLPDPRYTTLHRIPSNAKMGWVNVPPQYNELQALCREIADEADVSPIHLDVLAWNCTR